MWLVSSNTPWGRDSLLTAACCDIVSNEANKDKMWHHNYIHAGVTRTKYQM
jgi:hypothetical protein